LSDTTQKFYIDAKIINDNVELYLKERGHLKFSSEHERVILITVLEKRMGERAAKV